MREPWQWQEEDIQSLIREQRKEDLRLEYKKSDALSKNIVSAAASARLLQPVQEAFWGGYSGYFSDLDGFLWEVAWNPSFPIAEKPPELTLLVAAGEQEDPCPFFASRRHGARRSSLSQKDYLSGQRSKTRLSIERKGLRPSAIPFWDTMPRRVPDGTPIRVISGVPPPSPSEARDRAAPRRPSSQRPGARPDRRASSRRTRSGRGAAPEPRLRARR
jgi:hypothetical protein